MKIIVIKDSCSLRAKIFAHYLDASVIRKITYFFGMRSICFAFFLALGKSLVCLMQLNISPKGEDHIWVLWTTKNEKKHFDHFNSYYLQIKFSIISFGQFFNIKCLRLKAAVFFTLIIQSHNFFKLFKILFRRHQFLVALRVYEYFVFYIFFKRLKRQFVFDRFISLSESSPVAVAGLVNCMGLAGESIVITHGFPAKEIPPLLTKYALLFGQADQELYSASTSSKNVKFFRKGIIGARHNFPSVDNLNGNKILILTSLTTSLANILETVDDIRNNSKLKNYRLFIRLHPSKELFNQRTRNGLRFAKVEIVSNNIGLENIIRDFSFSIISNSTSILESLKMGVPVVYYQNLDSSGCDVYGFLKGGIVFSLVGFKDFDWMRILNFYKLETWKENFSKYDPLYLASESSINPTWVLELNRTSFFERCKKQL
jgi:hypothetical protein